MQENYNESFLPKFSFDTKKKNTHTHTYTQRKVKFMMEYKFDNV